MRRPGSVPATIAAFCLLISIDVFAQSPTSCTAEASESECICQGKTVDDPVHLPALHEQAVAIRRMLCLEKADRSEIYGAFTRMAYSQRGVWFSEYGGFKDGDDPLDPVLEALMDSNEDEFSVPNMLSDLNDNILVEGKSYVAAQPERCPTSDCFPVYDEFRNYYNYAHTTLASAGAGRFIDAVSGLSSQWDDYLVQSRSQTPLELIINSYFFKPDNDQQFFAPPDKQLIFLHPSLMIENVSDAIDGEKTIEALMLEIVGFDRWRNSAWYLPSGASIIAAYSDRPGVKDIGFGLALHFRSLYSIGFTDHDGANGILFSFDLLKLVADRKKTYEAMSR